MPQPQLNFNGNTDMWMKTSEAAKLLNLSDRSIRRKAKSGVFKFRYELVSLRDNNTKQMLVFIPEDENDPQRTSGRTPQNNQSPADTPADTSGHPLNDSKTNILEHYNNSPADTNDHYLHSDDSPADTSGHGFTSAKPVYTQSPADIENASGRNGVSAKPVYTSALTIREITSIFKFNNTTQAYRHAMKRAWKTTFQTVLGGGRRKLYLVPKSEIAGRKIIMPQTTNDSPLTINPKNVPAFTPLACVRVPESELHLAALRSKLCIHIGSIIDETPFSQKSPTWQALTDDYNLGENFPDLYSVEGKKSIRALQNWCKKHKAGGAEALVKKYHGGRSTVTAVEIDFLLNKLLVDNKIKIGSAIGDLKRAHREKRLVSNSNERTLRNAIDRWASNNRLIWNQSRFGDKVVKDKLLPSILRDQSLLKAGQIWCADGHDLAFDIIDPISGKAKRMTWLVFFDWGSRYPVGASLANTEDSAHILSAFRAGVLNMGAVPLWVYLDNGRAFKSKLFHGDWQNHDLSQELSGIYPRLGVRVKFAKAYNARAKGPIERFFRTFQDGFERFMETFRGSCIADKPAYLSRNEKWAQAVRDHQPLTLDQAKALINYYIRDVYGMTPHSGLDGKCPYEVFKAAQLTDEQKVTDFSKLNFLMLKIDRRKVNKEGIRFNNTYYHNDILPRHVGDNVIVRYDLMDVRSILVYDSKDCFICQAYLRRVTHPFVEIAMDQPVEEKLLKKQLDHQRKETRKIQQAAQNQMKLSQRAVDKLPQPTFNQQLKDSSFCDTPLIHDQSPKPEADPIAALDHRVPDTQDSESQVTNPESPKLSKIRSQLRDMGLNKA